MNCLILVLLYLRVVLIRSEYPYYYMVQNLLNSYYSIDSKSVDIILLMDKIQVDLNFSSGLYTSTGFAMLQSSEFFKIQDFRGLVVLLNIDINSTVQQLDAVLKKFEQTSSSSSGSRNEYWELDLSSELFIVSFVKSSSTPADKSHNYNIRSVTEVYNIKNITTSNVFLVEQGTNSSSNILQEINAKLKRRSNLRGVSIIGVSELKPGLVEEQSDGEVVFIGGYNVEEYRCLRDALNFTEDTVPWKGYIGMDSNGYLTGMGQQINDGEADISIQSQEILLYRAQRLTFLLPNLNNIEKLYVFFQQRKATSQGNIFFQTFSLEVWLVSIASWIVLSISICVLHKLNQRVYPFLPDPCCIPLHICTWGLATICQKGWHTLPARMSMRIVVLTGLLASYMLYQAFSASLVSLLSVPSVLIHSFNDILKYDFDLYTEKDTNAAHALVQNLQNQNLVQPFKSKIQNHAVSATEGLIKILTSKSAFISPVYLFYPKISSAIYPPSFLCQHVAKEDAYHDSTKSGMFIKKNSPFKELFNYKFMQMTERGIRHRLSKRYRVDGVLLNCLPEDRDSVRESIEFQELISAFLILLLSIPVGAIVLLVELYRARVYLVGN